MPQAGRGLPNPVFIQQVARLLPDIQISALAFVAGVDERRMM